MALSRGVGTATSLFATSCFICCQRFSRGLEAACGLICEDKVDAPASEAAKCSYTCAADRGFGNEDRAPPARGTSARQKLGWRPEDMAYAFSQVSAQPRIPLLELALSAAKATNLSLPQMA